MGKKIKRSLYIFMFALSVLFGSFVLFRWQILAQGAPSFEKYEKGLEWRVISKKVSEKKSLKENIITLFYPTAWEGKGNVIFNVIRDMTLWIMIIFIVWAWASLLINRDSKNVSKALSSLLYVVLWWVFIFWANRLFWSVLNFDQANVTEWEGIEWVKNALIWEDSVLFRILSVVKVFAFFLAIIMIVVTWFRVVSAWEWEKWKKLVKGLVNVVVALVIIKWVDFIYYMAADWNFVDRTATFIIDVAKFFAYLYWIIIVLMIIVAWYLYITDGWSWSWFKKASNLIVNIMLSALVLFGFLLILYQILAEFREDWDAVKDTAMLDRVVYELIV